MQRSAYIIVKVLIILFTGKVSCHKQKRGRRKRAHANQGASERQGTHMCSGNGGSRKLSGNGSSRKCSRRAATNSSSLTLICSNIPAPVLSERVTITG